MFKGVRKTVRTVLKTVVGVVALAVAGALFVAYSGMVNVAASNPSSGLANWFLMTTRSHSIAVRSRSIEVAALDKPGMLDLGADHYQEMCVGCHGAPGIDVGEAAQGMEPAPPKFDEIAKMAAQDAAQAFWVIKNGIRMTAMPAFGKTHDDHKIWAIVAFVKQLGDMTPDAYKKVADSASDDSDD